MSDLDREILEKAGLSATKVAELLGKTRQAVSKGIGGDGSYFSSEDLVKLSDAVAEHLPQKRKPLVNAVGDMFQTLSERIGASAPARSAVEAAIAEAERVWLIFPGFAKSLKSHDLAYRGVLDSIDERKPPVGLVAQDSPHLEVIAFCDRGRLEIEREFDEVWFDAKALAVIECEVVEMMLTPIVVVDPHIEDRLGCYALTEGGFSIVAPDVAADRVAAFGSHVTEKIRSCMKETSGRLLDAQHASAAEFLATRVHKI